MKNKFRIVTAVVTALVLVSSVASQAARSHPLDEDAALALLVRTLKHDRVYAKRISLDCITYDTEETTDAYFQFALREKHDAKSINSNPTETGLGFRGQNEQNYQNRITSFSLKPFCRFC